MVGSGAIGIEFASFYRTLGAEVTVVEVLDRVLPVEDEEISAFAAKAFTKQGMKLKVGTTVTELKKGADNVTCTLKAKDGKTEQVTVDRVILAMGIVGNVENIGLEAAGIKVDRTHVVAGKYGETGVDGVWAIGDLVGAPWLAHKAMHEGVIVAEKIAGVKGVHPLNTSNVPGCTYCWPQVASVGLTEAEGQGDRPQDQGRQVPLHRQRQGHRAGRGRRPGQDRVRCRDRRAAGRAHDRRRSHRTDPGLCHRQDRRTDRPGTGAHHLPASDPVGNDARSGAGGGRRGAAYLTPCHSRRAGLAQRGRDPGVDRLFDAWIPFPLAARRPGMTS